MRLEPLAIIATLVYFIWSSLALTPIFRRYEFHSNTSGLFASVSIIRQNSPIALELYYSSVVLPTFHIVIAPLKMSYHESDGGDFITTFISI
jgi:hypothetical protein